MTLMNLQKILFFCLGLILVVWLGACHADPSENSVAKVDCQPVKHVLGETCVPSNPERLVVLGVPTMVDAIALGVKPIGTIYYFEQTPPYLAGKLGGIQEVGIDNQPNLEKILTLTPDLIIAMNHSGLPYDQVSQIAPTVVDDWNGYPSWKEHFDFVAGVLGKTDKAKQVWRHYDQRIQELRSAIGSRYKNIEVSVVRACCNNLASDVENSFSGTIIEDAGLHRPQSQAAAEDGLVFFSEEKIPDLDGDIIFAIVDEDDASIKAFEQLRQEPLWNQLRAVQRGKVYSVNLATWRGGNPLAADAVIDDLFKYLVDNRAS